MSLILSDSNPEKSRLLSYIKFLFGKDSVPNYLKLLKHFCYAMKHGDGKPLKLTQLCAITLYAGPVRNWKDTKKVYRLMGEGNILSQQYLNIALKEIGSLRLYRRSITPRCQHPGCNNNCKPHHEHCSDCRILYPGESYQFYGWNLEPREEHPLYV
jgi:hypothetical protein